MDYKTFTAHVARNLGVDPKEAASMIAALAQVVSDKASSLDTVAIPGFGNFVSMKVAEHITNDPATGQQQLVPPQIKLQFVPSSMLKKQVTNE